jgi:hypothetical protein
MLHVYFTILTVGDNFEANIYFIKLSLKNITNYLLNYNLSHVMSKNVSFFGQTNLYD